jgi:hypothetical protein
MLAWVRTPHEAQANLFAAELLMPEEMFKPLAEPPEPSLRVVRQLAETFQTTLTATALRYIESCSRRCALVVSRNKQVEWFRTTKDFYYKLEKGTSLHQNSWAWSYFEGEDVPETIQTVRADAWLEGKRVRPRNQIKEHSIFLRRYGTVLTLLWIDDPDL